MNAIAGVYKGMRQVVRQFDILQTLQARHHGAAVPDLAEHLGVTVRTIQRDLIDLQEAISQGNWARA